MYTWIEINQFSLIRNVKKLREIIGEGTALYAVVKANAYGHGLELCSEAFWKAGIDGFMATAADDALFLAKRFRRTPVMLLTPPDAKDLANLITHEVRLPGVSKAFLNDVSLTALRHGKQALIHLKVETGMHRMGMTPEEVKSIIRESTDTQSPLEIEGVYTHIFDADNPEVTRAQASAMEHFRYELQHEHLPFPITHVFSSDSLLGTEHDYSEFQFDAVRFGRLLYGAKRPQVTTESSLTWKTRLITIKKIHKGDSVGYSSTYVSDRTRMIGVLPVGYFDGVDRRLGNKGFVLVQGKKCPIIGRVCMNNTIIDLSTILRPEVDDEVVLLGVQGQSAVLPEEWAEWCETIDDEILARIPGHIPRIKAK